MRSTMLMLICMFAIQPPSSSAQEVVHVRMENLPGKLESFLLTTPNVSVDNKIMGQVDDVGKATFSAVVATNPTAKAQERGLLVQLGHDEMKASVYLDQDCLQRLKRSLQSFRQNASKDVTDHRPHVSTIYNSQPGSSGTSDKVGVLQVGWYGHDDGWGIHIYVPPGKNGTGGGQFYFPETKFERLIEIINSSIMFLSSNQAHSVGG